MFVHHEEHKVTILLVYEDDTILTSSDIDYLGSLTFMLNNCFPLKDLGHPHFFLGIQILKGLNFIHLIQQKSVVDLLIKNGMNTSKSSKTLRVLVVLYLDMKLEDVAQFISFI